MLSSDTVKKVSHSLLITFRFMSFLKALSSWVIRRTISYEESLYENIYRLPFEENRWHPNTAVVDQINHLVLT